MLKIPEMGLNNGDEMEVVVIKLVLVKSSRKMLATRSVVPAFAT